MSGSVPATHLFIDWLAISQLTRVTRRNIQALLVQPIRNTNANWVDVIKAIQIGNSDLVDPIDHPCITRSHSVEPAAAPFASRGSAKLASEVVKPLRQLFVLGGQRPLAYARGVRLHHAYYAIHPMRRHTRSCACAAGRRIGGCHIRIGAVVDIKECPLCSFE